MTLCLDDLYVSAFCGFKVFMWLNYSYDTGCCVCNRFKIYFGLHLICLVAMKSMVSAKLAVFRHISPGVLQFKLESNYA